MMPTARTLEWLRKNGYTAGVVERRNPKLRHVTHDYLGIIDVIAVRENETIGVQATSHNGGNVSARVEKILAAENAPHWLKAGNRLLVVGWSKKGKRGQRKTWQPTLREIVLRGDFVSWFEIEDLLNPIPF